MKVSFWFVLAGFIWCCNGVFQGRAARGTGTIETSDHQGPWNPWLIPAAIAED